MVIGGWRGPGYLVADADPILGRQIRRQLVSAIARHGCPVDRDAVELAIAELWANALDHGPAGGRVLAGYCLWRRGARIVVCDGGGSATPRIVRDAGLADTGRGLLLVDELAARWGSFRLPGAQVVWADFGQQLRAPDSDAWAWLRTVLSGCTLSGPALPAAARPCGAAARRHDGLAAAPWSGDPAVAWTPAAVR